MKIPVAVRRQMWALIDGMRLTKLPPVTLRFDGFNLPAGIVFSRDRPLQLDALIRSFFECAVVPCRLRILYSVSDERYGKAYEEIEALYRNAPVEFYREEKVGGFRHGLLAILEQTYEDSLFFLVDDIIFTEQVDVKLLSDLVASGFIPTLRLGRNLNWCYTMHRKQPLPALRKLGSRRCQDLQATGHDLWAWRWISGQLDWGYPLSLDGNAFSSMEIRRVVGALDFEAPNSLEIALQKYKDSFLGRWGVCYGKSRLVNLPLNLVQREIANRTVGIDKEIFLKAWEAGKRINTAPMRGFQNTSAHQEVDLDFS